MKVAAPYAFRLSCPQKIVPTPTFLGPRNLFGESHRNQQSHVISVCDNFRMICGRHGIDLCDTSSDAFTAPSDVGSVAEIELDHFDLLFIACKDYVAQNSREIDLTIGDLVAGELRPIFSLLFLLVYCVAISA